MSFWHEMTWRTEGIKVTAPVKWRRLDGMVGVFWEAESQAGSRGYYVAEDPRLMVYFNDISSRVRISNTDGDLARDSRPMTRAIYIPAGVPMWTGSDTTHRFTHLNLHLHKDKLLKLLSPSVGSSVAQAALRRPAELQDVPHIETLAGLMVNEIANPSKHQLYAENLAGSIVAALLDLSEPTEDRQDGRLTQAQMNKLTRRVGETGQYRISVAEMAATVGLSESWFAHVFRQTTGQTPLQWLQARRVDLAKQMLIQGEQTVSGIAMQLGFSDQAHFTRVFRQVAGDTPAAWRRRQEH